MEKRGQFYLIAAIIIVGVIITLSSITNYITTRKEPVKFYDLSSELSQESARVVDYGIYKEENVPQRIENFTDEYFVYYSEDKEKGVELVFVYGDAENITTATFTTQDTGKISVDYGTSSFEVSGTNKYVANRKNFSPAGNEVKVKLLGAEYNFTIKEGENFFFILTKNMTEETYMARSPE